MKRSLPLSPMPLRAVPLIIKFWMGVLLLTLVLGNFLACPVDAAENLPLYKLRVSFDIEKNLIKGVSTILLQEEGEAGILSGNLRILSVRLNGLPIKPEINKGTLQIKGKGTLELSFEGIFSRGNIRGNPENAGVVTGDVIGSDGISLTGTWYPSLEGPAYYSLSVLLPGGFVAISEADDIKVSDTGQGMEYSFNFPHPINKIDLVAGKYREVKETFNGIDIYGYFFPEDISLARTYIEHAKKYLKMYEDLLSPYAYKRFSIVENFLPTGYSMPTFILLGQEVVRLPFIVRTSLGHEILHQWFGNSVYVDYKKGNWSEGLTTYLADQLYQEQEGKGWQYRKQILADYESYVNPGNEFPLKDFTGRVDFASKAIGYGKGAMFFHMLRRSLGDSIFFDALKEFIRENEFRDASWDDIRKAFEKTSGENLKSFFAEWLDRKGIIGIRVKEPRVVVLKGVPKVSFEIIQEGTPYKFSLPMKITTRKAGITDMLHIEKEKEIFDISSEDTPVGMSLDGNYDLMRRLSKEEYPPVISRLLGAEKRLVVVPSSDQEKYGVLVDALRGDGFSSKEEKDVGDEDIMTSSLLVLGYDSTILERLFAGSKKPGPGFSLVVKRNPLNGSEVIATAYGDSKQEVDLAANKIFHYGKYSRIRFEKGENVEKKTDETENGINVSLSEPVPGVETARATKLDTIINNIHEKPIIYAAEIHDSYADHKTQLAVIMGLYEKGRKFAIGMEMFQKPFQKAIDDYISGKINEKEFLKQTQYFRRWEFDYNFYREIIEFARAKKIPLVALNIRSEIIDKVSKGGLDSLTEEEKKEIPADMNMADEEYRKRLRRVFDEHGEFGSKNFDYFYECQILWDETMAHSVSEFLEENPGYQMVVLAGVGHIMYESGIPQRAYRLNAKSYVTLIPDTGTLSKDIATFVLFPKHISVPPTPKLGVILEEKDGRVSIKGFSHGSVSEKAGLKKGDVLISLDGSEIKSIDDVKIFLVDEKEGETVKVGVLRKKFLFGEKKLEISVTL